ncbi:hypothetical protein GCM10027072_23890 [Streptomyces bullii]
MVSAAGAQAEGDRRNVSDAAGVVVLGACAGWSLITAAAQDGRPEGMLLAVLAVTAGYAAGRIGGALLPVAAPCSGALAGIGLTVAVPHLTPGPQIVAPLGHAGATAAVLTLSAGAACCAAWASPVPAVRLTLRWPPGRRRRRSPSARPREASPARRCCCGPSPPAASAAAAPASPSSPWPRPWSPA